MSYSFEFTAFHDNVSASLAEVIKHSHKSVPQCVRDTILDAASALRPSRVYDGKIYTCLVHVKAVGHHHNGEDYDKTHHDIDVTPYYVLCPAPGEAANG